MCGAYALKQSLILDFADIAKALHDRGIEAVHEEREEVEPSNKDNEGNENEEDEEDEGKVLAATALFALWVIPLSHKLR